MRVAHVTSWLSPRGGGIPPVITGLVRENIRAGIECVVAGLRGKFLGPNQAVRGLKMVVDDAIGPDAFSYSPGLERRLAAEIDHATIVHSHGLWMHSGIIARRVSRHAGAPLVISPHGMLEPWALKNAAWKKRVAGWLFENENFRQAACLHALCEAEACNARAYGLRNPIAVIPNGIDPDEFSSLPDRQAIEADLQALKGRRRMLFLARIHPKKGLLHLLDAWQRIASAFPEWILLVGGDCRNRHGEEMLSSSDKLIRESKVLFLGPLYGEAKKIALAGSDAFVLPSFSEGFSMAALEAAACGLPIIMTPQCNFGALTSAGGGIEIDPDVRSCEEGLRRILSMTDDERTEMGARGRRLIETTYTWTTVSARLATVYSWLLGQTSRPADVWLN